MKRSAWFIHNTCQRLKAARWSWLAGMCALLLLALLLLGNDNARWKAAARAASNPAAPLMNCVPPPPNMVAWFPMDELAGETVAQDIQGGHNGTPKPGTVLGTNSPAPVPGKVAGAFRFSGISNGGDVPHLEVQANTDFDFAASPFTIDAWINVDPAPAGDAEAKFPIVNKFTTGTNNNKGYFFYVLGTQLVLETGANNGVISTLYATPSNVVAPGVWQHVAVSVTLSVGTFFVNGAPAGTFNVNSASPNNTAPLLIGKSAYPPTPGFNAYRAGVIDELEIFNRALIQSEIALIWGADSAGKCKPGKSCCGAWQARTPNPAPSPRFRHAMAEATKCKKVVLFGGQTGAAISTVDNETWEWDAVLQTWSKITPTGGVSPSARAGHAMAYDPVHDRVVLFGGYDAFNVQSFQTWEYDCATHTWTNRTHPGINPPPRAYHAMAYDPAKGIVLYGGQGASNPLGDTWIWTGNGVNPVWATAGTSSLGPRVEHAMAYDGSKLILFGGSSTFGGVGLDDTWTLNFANFWSQLTTTMAPSPRRGHAMALGKNCSRVILYGGNPGNNTAFPTDTWEWDGMKWCQLSTNSPPGERENTAMAYDGAFPLTFGGRKFDQSLLGDTWLYGCNAPSTYPAGKADNFSLAGTMDTVYRRPELNTAFPNVTWKKFDVTTVNQWVGHSFDMSFLPNGIARAEVEVRMKPGSTGNPINDSINFAFAKTGDPTPIKWGIQMGTLLGSPWPLASAQTFTFDLANLPASGTFSTNLLQQFIANKFLDVVIQNDTIVDYIKLRVWLCPAEVAWGGVGGQPGGQAQLAVNSNGNLVISSIGASGNDGATFRLGEAGSFGLSTANQVSSLPNGTQLEVRSIGRLNDVPGSLLNSLRFNVGDGRVSLTPNFNPLGSPNYDVAFYQNYSSSATSIASRSNLSGSAVSFPSGNFTTSLFFLCCPWDEVPAVAIATFSVPVIVRVGTQEIGQADGIVFTPRNPTQQPGAITHLQIAAANLPTGLPLKFEGVSAFLAHDDDFEIWSPSALAIGNARLEPFTSGLGVANLGTTGADGVTFDLKRAQSFSLNFDGIDMNRDLPPGAYLQANVTNIFPPSTPPFVTSLKLIKGPPLVTAAPRTQYVADFSALGATAWRVTGFNGTTQVADVSSFTGTVETTVFPGSLSHTGLTTLGFQVDFPDGATLFLNGASNGSITSLRVLPQSSNTQIAYLTQLALLASDIPRVSFTDPAIVPVCNSALTLTPAGLPPAVLGVPYPASLRASGGLPPHQISATGLPPGLTLSRFGDFSGAPTQTGIFNVTVTATDGLGCTGTKNYTLVVCPNITLNPATLNNGTVGTPYSATLTATGGTPPYTFTTVGSLPPGLTLSPTGLLSGTPVTSGSFTFGLQATSTDSGGACAGTRAYTLVINCPTITLNPLGLTNGSVGAAYGPVNFTATGGTAPYSFARVNGAFPPGLTLTTAGVFTGTPTQAGTFNFSLEATDANGCKGTRSYALVIDCPAITISPAALSNARVNLVYSVTLTASGGTSPYSFTRVTGALPPGLTLAPLGTLSGLPTQAGTFNFTVAVADGNGCPGTRAYTLMVVANAVKGDFDGDGLTDLGVFRPSAISPNWFSLNSSNAVAVAQTWGGGYAPYNDVPVPGDYDGDRVTDYAIWRGADSIWYIRKSSDGGAILDFWGANYTPYFDIPVPGDYDGDRIADIAVFRRSGTWFVKRSSNGSVLTQAHGQTGDIPVPADYDGDGITDFAVFRPDAVAPVPNWIILQSSTNTVVSYQWGGGYAPYFDTPIPADYDGDNKADLAIWRGADSIWYIRKSSDGGFILDLWGANYAPYFDIPVPGDYDGDRKADIAVFRRSGTWFVKRSSNGSFLIQDQGQQGDLPIPAHGVR